MNDVIAIVLGGGAGSRLRPLTEHRSKPAVPFLGKYRLIDVPISNCLNSGVDRVFVLTQFNSASLNRHIAETYRFDDFGDRFVSILAAEQTPESKDWYAGTADAVRQVLHHLKKYAYSHILILSADQIYQIDFKDMLRHHLQQKADVSVAAIPVSAHEAASYGILKTDAEYRITKFCEKPAIEDLRYLRNTSMGEMAPSYLASSGIYLFKRHVLDTMLIYNPHFMDFGREVIPDALNN